MRTLRLWALLAVFAFIPTIASAQENNAYAVGATLYARGLYSDAADQFHAFVKAAPQDGLAARALFLAAEARRRSGNVAAAYDLYQQVSRTYPQSPQASFALLRATDIEITNGKTEGRAKTLQSLRGLPPDAESLRTFLLAKVLSAEKREEEALRTIEQAEGTGIIGGAAYLVKGDMALSKNDFATALAAYNKAAKEERLKPSATLRLAELARRSTRHDEALRLYRSLDPQALPTPREKAVYAAGLGLSLLATGDHAAAKQHLSSALQLARNADDVTRSAVASAAAPALSVSCLMTNDSKTLDELIVQLPQGDVLTFWLRAWGAFRRSDHRTALDTARAGLATVKNPADPAAVDLRLVGALASAELKDWSSLKSLLESTFSGYPEHIFAYLDVLLRQALAVPPAELNQSLEALLKTSPPPAISAWAEALLAFNAIQTGDLDNADARIKAFSSAYPGNAFSPHLRKALLAASCKSAPPQKVVQFAQEYIASNPSGDTADAHELLAWGLYSQGLKKEAAQALLKAREMTKDASVKARLIYAAGLATAEGGDEDSAARMLLSAHSEGFVLPPDAALWLVLRRPAAEAASLADRIAPALKSSGAAARAALHACYRIYSAVARWNDLAAAMDVFLSSRDAGGVDAEDRAIALLYKGEAELNLDRAASAFTLVDTALPTLSGFNKFKGFLIRGRAQSRLGKPEDALSDLLYVGLVASPSDDLSRRLVRDALTDARALASQLGKQDLLAAIDSTLNAASRGQ